MSTLDPSLVLCSLMVEILLRMLAVSPILLLASLHSQYISRSYL